MARRKAGEAGSEGGSAVARVKPRKARTRVKERKVSLSMQYERDYMSRGFFRRVVVSRVCTLALGISRPCILIHVRMCRPVPDFRVSEPACCRRGAFRRSNDG